MLGSAPLRVLRSRAADETRGAHLQFDNEWTLNRIQPNDFINGVRARVDLWRMSGYQHVTSTARQLLGYWADEYRENRVLFAQREPQRRRSTSPRLPRRTARAGCSPGLRR